MPIPLPTIPGEWRVALNWHTSGGLTATNVMHIGTATSGVFPPAVMALLDAHVTAAMWGTVGGQWSVGDVAITALDGTSSTHHFIPASPSHWEGGTGGDVVPGVASIVKLTTGVRGRANRGRLFLPSPAESQMANGRLTDGTEVTAGVAWNAFQAALVADATTPAALDVASYDRRHSGAGAHGTGVQTIIVEQVLATQRRRQTRLR